MNGSFIAQKRNEKNRATEANAIAPAAMPMMFPGGDLPGISKSFQPVASLNKMIGLNLKDMSKTKTESCFKFIVKG